MLLPRAGRDSSGGGVSFSSFTSIISPSGSVSGSKPDEEGLSERSSEHLLCEELLELTSSVTDSALFILGSSESKSPSRKPLS